MRPNSSGREYDCGISHSKLVGFRKNSCIATANASVVTASNSPDTRSAGRPSSSATRPPASAHSTRAMKVSMPHVARALAMTTAPTPMSATWPRLTTPPHPVSTTSERAVSAKVTARVARLTCDGDPTTGMTSSRASTRSATTPLSARTSGSFASWAGRRRPPPVSDHELSPAWRARLVSLGCTSRPTITTSSSIT